MANVIIRAGGPCTCARGRYVRFAVPTVPGLTGHISCRGVDAAREDVREHELPPGAQIEVRVGVIHG